MRENEVRRPSTLWGSVMLLVEDPGMVHDLCWKGRILRRVTTVKYSSTIYGSDSTGA
jgi:hypothetical protein